MCRIPYFYFVAFIPGINKDFHGFGNISLTEGLYYHKGAQHVSFENTVNKTNMQQLQSNKSVDKYLNFSRSFKVGGSSWFIPVVMWCWWFLIRLKVGIFHPNTFKYAQLNQWSSVLAVCLSLFLKNLNNFHVSYRWKTLWTAWFCCCNASLRGYC